MSGLKNIKTVDQLDITEKVVFLRLDLNVPLHDGKITDETRLTASLPTIKHCVDRGAKVILASHLGRPKGPEDKEFSLEPVAQRLSEVMGMEVLLVEDPASDAIKALLTGLKKNQLILLENLRFEKGETKNSEDFAQKLAAHVQVYVNDAFGASHRAHASIDALPRLIKEKGVGFLIKKEIEMLDKLLLNPERPYWAILGGAKVSDKIPVIEKLIDVVDGFVIGGAMAYTFLKAQGFTVGMSMVETDKLHYAREMLARLEARNKSLLLPVDHIVASKFDSSEGKLCTTPAIDEGFMGLDIGPESAKRFGLAISKAKTIFWNGPMGVFENPAFAKGTFALAKAVSETTGLKIVGGGDSAAAAEASGLAEKMTHISTGGGASLEYLQGDKLPGLEVLRQRQRS